MKTLLAVLLLAAVGAGWYFREKLPPAVLNLLPNPASHAAAAVPASNPAPAAPEPSASLAGTPAAPTVGTVPALPAAAPLVVPPAPTAAALARLVGESQRRAVALRPALGEANSELNSRFVFRYKALKAKNDLHLSQPDWPERLADECAADMRPASAKPSASSAGGKVAQVR